MDRAGSEWVDWAGSRDLHVELAPRGDRRAALERSVRGGDPRRPAGRRRPPAFDPRAGRRPRPRARDGRRGLRAAHRRGLPDGAAGRADAGGLRCHRRRPAGTARHARRPAPGSRARHARRQRLPARSLAARRCGAASPHAPDSVLGYRDLRGRPELRAALAAYLGRSRGVVADPDRIVVCAGFNEGLALLLAALPVEDRWRWRTRAWTSTARSCARRAARSCRWRSTRTARCRAARRADADAVSSPPRTSSRSARRSPPSGGRRSWAGRASAGRS